MACCRFSRNRPLRDNICERNLAQILSGQVSSIFIVPILSLLKPKVKRMEFCCRCQSSLPQLYVRADPFTKLR
jgi:hypothetical protein